MKIIITEQQLGIIKEEQNINFNIRKWSHYLLRLIRKNDNDNFIVNGSDYPDAYEKFPVDEFNITIMSTLQENSGMYDENESGFINGKYVIKLIFARMIDEFVINHELRHAYEDFMRKKNNGTPLSKTKEVHQLMSGDFADLMLGRRNYGIFNQVFKGLYMTSKVEESAYGETIYDGITPIFNMVKQYMNNSYNVVSEKNRERYENHWKRMKEDIKIPILDKFNDYQSFLNWADKRINERGEKVLKKLHKINYYRNTNGV